MKNRTYIFGEFKDENNLLNYGINTVEEDMWWKLNENKNVKYIKN